MGIEGTYLNIIEAIYDKPTVNIILNGKKLKELPGNWTATYKRMKLAHSLTPYTNINSKWIKDLDIRPDTIKLLEENKDQTLSNINHSNIFSDLPPRVMTIKTTINQWDLIKLEFLHSKGNPKQTNKKQPTE